MSAVAHTVDEAADKLNLHPETVRRLCRAGILKAATVGMGLHRRSWRITPEEIQRYLTEGASRPVVIAAAPAITVKHRTKYKPRISV